MSHRAEIEAAFTQQAAAFEDARLNRVFTADVAWVFDRLPRDAGDLVLDVAAGTGHAARLLAPAARTVVALDATAAMLEQGQAKAREEGLANIVFLRGDAAALPFLDASFDVVVSRFALHHFEDAAGPLAEMRRCLRPGGHLVVADLVSDPDPAVAARQNALEILRDPSHTRMLTVDELADAFARHGLTSVHVDVRALERPLEPWLAVSAPAPDVAEEIRTQLRAEVAGERPASGLQPRAEGDELWFVQTFAALTGAAPLT